MHLPQKPPLLLQQRVQFLRNSESDVITKITKEGRSFLCPVTIFYISA